MNSEPRKIVLILGNGFDLDLGLKTSYQDFWDSMYCPKDYPAPLIRHLNEKWPKNREGVKWYDLENELFAYYRELQNIHPINDVITLKEREFLQKLPEGHSVRGYYKEYEAEIQSLIKKGILIADSSFGAYIQVPYLKDLKEHSIWRDRRAFALIKERLCQYLRKCQENVFMGSTPASVVLGALDYARRNGDFLNIFTFNYTSLPSRFNIIPDDVLHYVHGDCDQGNIIIGTIDDGSYSQDYDFLQKSFDPDYNPPAITEALRDADDVVFFGHSIGSNDRQYFKAFFKQQTAYETAKGKRITIFTRDEHSVVEIKRSLQQMTDNSLSALYCLNSLQIITTADIPQNPANLRCFLNSFISDTDQVRFIIDGVVRSAN